MKISTKISSAPWGDVDKSAIGSTLAAAYANGSATKAQIKFVYLSVTAEAFTKDADGNPKFLASKCSFPVAEVSDTAITLNSNGVHAAAQRLAAGSNLTGADLTAAKRRLRGLYRKLKETPPDSIKESLIAIGRGTEVTELVKGSAEYTLDEIRTAFGETFQIQSPYSGNMICPWSIQDTFVDAIVVRAWGDMNDLAPDEFYRVTYSKAADGTYTFADEADWEVVELTYQTQSAPPPTPPVSTQGEGATGDAITQETRKRLKDRGARVIETLPAAIEFVETTGASADGPWRIRGTGITADIVNGNGRRYPAAVLRRAVNDLKQHITESAGQGRALSLVTGESDHPSDKGHRRPLYSEIVVNWDNIVFDGKIVTVEGLLLGTQEGRDIRARALGGVLPGLSQRSYIESKPVKEHGGTVDEVTDLLITGYDFTVPGEQSDPNGAAHTIETQQGELKMTREELELYLKEHPELFKGLVAGEVSKMSDEAIAAIESKVRDLLHLDPKADIGAALTAAHDAQETLQRQARQKAIDDAIAAETKDLPYGDKMNALFVEAVRSANPQDEKAVKAVVESKRQEYDAMAAEARLGALGFTKAGSVKVTGPVIERELGIPAFAIGSHHVTEALVRRGLGTRRDFRDEKKLNVNQLFTKAYLDLFDQKYQRVVNPRTNQVEGLAVEARLVEEQELSTDFNLPYSVSRTIIEQALPQLIAASVFDIGTTDQAPSRIYYETFAGESGYTVAITNEDVIADTGVWVAMAHKHITPGTVVVEPNGGGTAFVEGDDYVVDYLNGRFKALASPGTISDSATVDVDYTYTAIRKGENAPIERGKMTLAYKTLEIAADRLADYITSEAVVFSRSQLGWDATTRTINSLIGQIRRTIDQGLFYLGLSAALSVASNSGGSWANSGTDYEVAVAAIGAARVLVAKRFYTPTFILMSLTNSDLIGNWEGFAAAGARPDQDINAEGYIGRLKGLPVFASTEFPDSYILTGNREIVAHRVFSPMAIKGPFPTFDPTTHQLIAADQYFCEEYNGSDAPVAEKAAYVTVT